MLVYINFSPRCQYFLSICMISPKWHPKGLEQNLANIFYDWPKSPGSILVAFLEWKHTISASQAAPERHARSLVLSIYICMGTACRPFYEARWITGLLQGRSDRKMWTTHSCSLQFFKMKTKWISVDILLREIINKYITEYITEMKHLRYHL